MNYFVPRLFLSALLLLYLATSAVAQIISQTDPLLIKAEALARQGKLQAAEVAAREFLQTRSSSADGHYLLGYILFLQSKATESLAEYTHGAKYRTPSAIDLKVVGSNYVVLGDYADADKWFTKVVEWTPQDGQAWYDLGRTKYNENRFDEAIAAFKRVLQLDPASVMAEDNLGLSYQGEGHNEEAMAAYRRAIELQQTLPVKDSGPYLNLGSLFTDLGRTAEALPVLTRALEIAGEDFRVHRELGKAYLRRNDPAKAQIELQKAVELAPANAPLHFMLAQVYRKQGLAEKARAETERYTALK